MLPRVQDKSPKRAEAPRLRIHTRRALRLPCVCFDTLVAVLAEAPLGGDVRQRRQVRALQRGATCPQPVVATEATLHRVARSLPGLCTASLSPEMF